MTTHSLAEALIASVLEGEDPKDFLQRHMPELEKAKGTKRVAEYDLENIGIDNSQYFTGRGTAYTNWDEVFVGAGDNPAEAIADALDQAASNGWLIDDINTDNWPEVPSVTDEIRSQAADEARSLVDEDDYEDIEEYKAALEEKIEELMENGESDLYYYAAVYLRQPGEGEVHHTLQQHEAEDPKEFFKRMKEGPPRPSTWPEFKRWSGKKWNTDRRRAFHMVKRHNIRRNPDGSIARDAEGQAFYDPYEIRHGLRNTRFQRNLERGEHSVEFHNTDVLTWDRFRNVMVDTGGYKTLSTRDRINMFLPGGWRIWTYQGNWYWSNHEWPENIRDRIHSDLSARRKPSFPWWIPFERGDTIRPDGTLIFGASRDPKAKRGIAKPNGELKLEIWNDIRPPPQGVLHPPRRGRQNAYDPNQMMLRLEGKYMRQLARWKRIQAKHDRIKEVGKIQREVEKVDKPSDKKKPKKGHQHLR